MANPMLETTLYLVGEVAHRGYLDKDIEKRWHHFLSVWRLVKEETSANLMSHIHKGMVDFDNSKHSMLASYNPWSTSNYSKNLESLYGELKAACDKRAALLRFKSDTFNPEQSVIDLIAQLSNQIDTIGTHIKSVNGAELEHTVDGVKIKGNALDLQVAWMLLKISELKHQSVMNPSADKKDHVYNVGRTDMQSLSEAYQAIVQMIPMKYSRSNTIPKKSNFNWQQILDAKPESGSELPELKQRASLRCMNENYEWLLANLEGTIQGHKEQGETVGFKPELLRIMATEFRDLCQNHQGFKQVPAAAASKAEDTSDKPAAANASKAMELSPLAAAVVYCIQKRISEKNLSPDAQARYHRTMEIVNEMGFLYKVQMMDLIEKAEQEFKGGWLSQNYINALKPLFEKFHEAAESSMSTQSPRPLNTAFEETRAMVKSLRGDVSGEFDRLRSEALAKKKSFPSETDVSIAWLHLSLGSFQKIYEKQGFELPIMLDMLNGLERIMKTLPTALPRTSSHSFLAGPTGRILSENYLNVAKMTQYLNWGGSTDPQQAKQSLQFITSKVNGHFKDFQTDLVVTAEAYKSQGKPIPFDVESLSNLLQDMQSTFVKFVAKANDYWEKKAVEKSAKPSPEQAALEQKSMLSMFQGETAKSTGQSSTTLADLVRQSENDGPTTRSKSKNKVKRS